MPRHRGQRHVEREEIDLDAEERQRDRKEPATLAPRRSRANASLTLIVFDCRGPVALDHGAGFVEQEAAVDGQARAMSASQDFGPNRNPRVRGP
jgi:hypothetical protein